VTRSEMVNPILHRWIKLGTAASVALMEWTPPGCFNRKRGIYVP
jgi:hypothetical protein